jgi:hypothetical protein
MKSTGLLQSPFSPSMGEERDWRRMPPGPRQGAKDLWSPAFVALQQPNVM